MKEQVTREDKKQDCLDCGTCKLCVEATIRFAEQCERDHHLLFPPPDIWQANEDWGANCGPVALAAIIGETVMSVRDYFSGFETKQYVNPTQMQAAIKLAGFEFSLTDYANGKARQTPRHGVAFLQFSGGFWDSKPIFVQYQHTHWIAVDGDMIFDVNEPGGWLTKQEWKEQLLPAFKEHNKYTGAWIRAAFEVLPF